MSNHAQNTIAGTLLTICGVGIDDIIKTVALAVIGATVSFGVSVFWKWIKDRNNNQKSNT